MKRRRDEAAKMEIVWQTPANPPERGDYIFRNGNEEKKLKENLKLVYNYCVFFLKFSTISFFIAGKRYVRPYHFEFISHVLLRIALNRVKP